ncbi:CD209 antigen-like protein C [Micropterus salmoides]|uniref:CD209 antigen-like protein C n=1 Tax=Micropterus salmoides TaxID=27706 RepID=UPI0018EAD1E6|nr:CD209 antigen-like protein C [Micropterus salmoides]
MPASIILAAPDSSLNVRYTERVQENRRAGEENEVEISEDEEHHTDPGSQQARPQTLKNRVKRRCFTAATLGVMYLLILAGVFIRYISVTLENDQLQARYNKLYNNYSELQGKVSGKWCPKEWKRFGCSCYFKSNENKSWSDSRSDCQRKGADLVVINNKEEQDFIIGLNKDGDSWIGLLAMEKWTQTKRVWEWEWVDSSPLTETFWAAGLSHQPWIQYTACCNQQGQWTQSGFYVLKNWICEK